MKTFGEKLKELRDERNMLQSEMAELLGVSRKTIIEYENGNCKPIRKNLIKYAQILEVPVMNICCDDRYNICLLKCLTSLHLEVLEWMLKEEKLFHQTPSAKWNLLKKEVPHFSQAVNCLKT